MNIGPAIVGAARAVPLALKSQPKHPWYKKSCGQEK